MMPICFVDTETTGLHVDKQLWEVAIIRRDFEDPATSDSPHYAETRYETFVPVDLSNASLQGLNIGHFYERHPYGRHLANLPRLEGQMYYQEMKKPHQVAIQIAKMTHGARFIGAAPSFDAEVLGDFLRKHGLLPTWNHRLVDTHDLLTGYLAAMNYERGGLSVAEVFELSKDEKVKMLGLKPHTGDSVHTAMGDAQHEADIWDAIMG